MLFHPPVHLAAFCGNPCGLTDTSTESKSEDERRAVRRRLTLAIVLSLIFMLMEVIGGTLIPPTERSTSGPCKGLCSASTAMLAVNVSNSMLGAHTLWLLRNVQLTSISDDTYTY